MLDDRKVCEMQSAETVLSVLRERGRRSLPLNELYRQLFNPQLYLLAYGLSAYDLMCRGAYEFTFRGRRGDHGMGSPPVTRASRSLSRQDGPLMASTSQ
jgi:hypothetical protein